MGHAVTIQSPWARRPKEKGIFLNYAVHRTELGVSWASLKLQLTSEAQVKRRCN